MVHQREFEFWGDPKRGTLLREIGIDAAEWGNSDWVDVAEAVVQAVCRTTREFTTDRVWFYLEDGGREWVREPRALGAVMRRAASNGWCDPTPRVTASVRAGCHRRPVRVWRSRICAEGGVHAET